MNMNINELISESRIDKKGVWFGKLRAMFKEYIVATLIDAETKEILYYGPLECAPDEFWVMRLMDVIRFDGYEAIIALKK